MKPDWGRCIIWVSAVSLWGCGANFPPANPEHFIEHTFTLDQSKFSVLLPPELQLMPPDRKEAVVFTHTEDSDRTRRHMTLSALDQTSKSDYLSMVSLESGASFSYGIFDYGDSGSGGPERLLTGDLDFGSEQMRVQCYAQAEWASDPQWCIPLLHHIVRNEVAEAPALIEATLAGDVEDVRQLLEQGTNPNLVYHTNTALTYAARDGFTEIARLLIDYGADVNWIDGEGVTPLILASFKDHIDLVRLLLAHGADVTVRDQWNRTALDYALRRGETDPIVQLLKVSG
ncbi:MAG: ankyrin repeat domain-containing protein [Cyanobacteria bacterium P01_F01_bin.116]